MSNSHEELELTREQLERAERALEALRHEVLPQNPARFRLMAESYVEQIRSLRAQIDAYLGIDLLLEEQTSIAIGLEGARVHLGETAVGVLTRTLDTFRRGLQAIVEHTAGTFQQSKAGGRRKKWIEQLCDPPLIAVAPGSVRLILGEPDTGTLFSEEDLELYRRNLKLLFAGLAWAAGEQSGDEIDDPELRRSVLSIVRKLVPPRTGPVEAVSFRSRSAGFPKAVRLHDAARIRLDRELARLSESEEYTEVRGTIREVDLDARSFILRDRCESCPELPCEYDEPLEPEVKAFLDEPVIVTGLLRRSGKNSRQVMEVESIEPDPVERDSSLAE